ncbi:helix-turn-helix domain-containing protein [Methylomonas sp. CM2]|uniref:helix-turn-helix domain-containing protein n=1 Tax=Methylomonas sp. CM2 TaxID=3417647 RepID=UPI003CECDC75
MKTLDLHTAADLLHMHPSTVLAKARAGDIPAAKPGKAWVFIDDDLIAYLRGLYTAPRQDASELKKEAVWSSSLKKPDQTTGITNSALTERLYIEALAPKTNGRRKKSPTKPERMPTTLPRPATGRAGLGKKPS